jgi:hypothetical protein
VIHPNDLMRETEARWRLVETAWELGVSRSLIAFDQESEDFYVQWRDGRIVVTSARSALNGYQKGLQTFGVSASVTAAIRRRHCSRPLGDIRRRRLF